MKAYIRSCPITFTHADVKGGSNGATKNSSSNSNSAAQSGSTTTTINDELFIAGAQQLLNQLRNPTADVDLTEDTQFASNLVDQIQYSLDYEKVYKINADEVRVGFIGIINCRIVKYIHEKTMKASAYLASVTKERKEGPTDTKIQTIFFWDVGLH